MSKPQNLPPNLNLFGETVSEKKIKSYGEFEVQKAVCKYIALTYPDVPFYSDTIAFVELTQPQRIRNMLIQKNDYKTPDLSINFPVGRFHSLFIEVKVDSPYKKKSDELLKNDHLEAQNKTLVKLRSLGFAAEFGVGYKHCIFIIDNYLQKKDIDFSYLSYRKKIARN